MENDKKTDEKSGVMVVGHILIRDKDTQEVLLNQRDTNTQGLGNTDAG